MMETLEQASYELAVANRIVAREGVLDAFGHISMRHPLHSDRYLLARSRAPELVEATDVLEFTLDSNPATATDVALYGERVIHGEIYKARPDVGAICHHHSAAILPFCITDVELIPVYHQGATLGTKAPVWDSRTEFGSTNIMVITPDEGGSLARALGPHWIVLMRRHGATVAGTDIRECVFRSIYSHRNAELQWKSQVLGKIEPLNQIEAEKAGPHNLKPIPIARAWEYWSRRLEKADEMPSRCCTGNSTSPLDTR
jgi:ribulose-5-phosphate 4-epimerase/fuculose-1-phosphate aldolase